MHFKYIVHQRYIQFFSIKINLVFMGFGSRSKNISLIETCLQSYPGKHMLVLIPRKQINKGLLRKDNLVMTLLDYGLAVTSEKCTCILCVLCLTQCYRYWNIMFLHIHEDPISIYHVLNV